MSKSSQKLFNMIQRSKDKSDSMMCAKHRREKKRNKFEIWEQTSELYCVKHQSKVHNYRNLLPSE